MNRKIYDYSGLSLKTLKTPRYAHILLLCGTWIIYFALYFITENLIPESACHPIHCALDDMIPFNEYFLVFYCGWYLLVGGSLAYYFFYDVKQFCRLDLYIFITQIIAMTAYILYPSRQDLRPEVFDRQNVFTFIMGIIYAFDTNTGVCPSLHVAYSLAIFSVISKDKNISVLVKVLVGIFVICVALSTAFVKQHSMVDVFMAIPTALAGEILIYGVFPKKFDKIGGA